MRKLAKTCWWETDWSDTSLQKYHSVIKTPNLKAKKDKNVDIYKKNSINQKYDYAAIVND